jgi:CPA2 family monovalent cation:H+ antiporter-2
LQGHTRAGAEIFAMAFSRQMATEEEVPTPANAQRLHAALPGLGEPTPVTIREDSAAVGKSLRQLDLRGTTGATGSRPPSSSSPRRTARATSPARSCR